jgi:protein SCO1/2
LFKEFHPRFAGLTGSDEQVQAAAKAFRIYISRGDVGQSGDENDYLVDHSIFFFLMDPQFTFMDFFGRNSSADDIADTIVKRVRQWKKDELAGRLNGKQEGDTEVKTAA